MTVDDIRRIKADAALEFLEATTAAESAGATLSGLQHEISETIGYLSEQINAGTVEWKNILDAANVLSTLTARYEATRTECDIAENALRVAAAKRREFHF